VYRITMGWTPEEQALADSLGYQGYLEHHLNYTAINDSAIDDRVATYSTIGMQPYQLVPSTISNSQCINELIETTILRSVFSKRQLFQRMVEFWTDHFNIDILKEIDSKLKTIDDREVIRAHALGSFPAMLWASMHSPAMLYYLDNHVSTAGNPNENYGRELLELHSLGVNGGYTQTDVVEISRCLTGWGLYPSSFGGSNPTPQQEALRWTFRYNNGQHDNGAKVLLGSNIPAGGGQNDGMLVWNIISAHPSTATFIATKLCTWFYGENPPAPLVTAVASTYTSTNGDIKEMIRKFFSTVDPATAPPVYKRPYHLFVSAMRASGAEITATSGIRTNLSSAGHLPFYWSPPDGYPNTLEAWVGLILPRWNFGASLFHGTNTNAVSGTTVDIAAFFSGVVNTAVAHADAINNKLFGGAMPQADYDRVRTYLLPDPPSTARKREAVGLAIGSPGYQWY
jgi:uncharacterized protein (DUF1800 family)